LNKGKIPYDKIEKEKELNDKRKKQLNKIGLSL